MFLELNLNSEIPIYVQIKDQIICLIAKNELKEGDKLPSVRQLSTDIGVNLHTINKAYSILKETGFLVVNRRKGVLVNAPEFYRHDDNYLESLKELLNPIVTEAIARKVDRDTMQHMIKAIYEQMEEGAHNG